MDIVLYALTVLLYGGLCAADWRALRRASAAPLFGSVPPVPVAVAAGGGGSGDGDRALDLLLALRGDRLVEDLSDVFFELVLLGPRRGV